MHTNSVFTVYHNEPCIITTDTGEIEVLFVNPDLVSAEEMLAFTETSSILCKPFPELFSLLDNHNVTKVIDDDISSEPISLEEWKAEVL